MKKRNILLGIICFVFLSILTGCGNKTAINTAQFKSIAENKGYTITDATSQYAQYGYINEATIASNNNEWQAEFYVLSDEGNATSMYNTNLEILPVILIIISIIAPILLPVDISITSFSCKSDKFITTTYIILFFIYQKNTELYSN